MKAPVELCREDDSSLRIGVVGHRMDRLTTEDAEVIEARIGEALDQIRRSLQDVELDQRRVKPRIVTSLAEGADRIVAKKAVEMGLLETVVLPFPRNRFAEDFLSHESKREFETLLAAAASIIEPSVEAERLENCYESASAIIIECADMLIAVWDGQPGRGRGGTAHTIESALRRSVSVIWVDSRAPYPVKVIRPETPATESLVAHVLTQIESENASGIPYEARANSGGSATLTS